ncbi:MAG: type II secretion system minor pseudopilin GspK, partial [Quisquiliibacterium sp.]
MSARLYSHFRRNQEGAAIVTALLIVTLATTVVAGLFVRENVTLRSAENRQALAQSRWIERAAIDWARVILRADAR